MHLPRSPYPFGETLATLRRMFSPSPAGGAVAQSFDLVPGGVALRWIGFAGDVMPLMGRTLAFTPDVPAFFADCERVVANLEGIVTEERWVPFLQRHSPAVFDALASLAPAARWVLGIANNHAPDYGDAGFDQTLRAIEHAKMAYVGTVERPRLALAPGVTLSAWTEWTNGTSRRVPTRDPGCARAQAGDVAIAFPHWGYEFERLPRASQRASLPAGYDVVVGHHSHLPQPLERIGDRLVAWSLGNFSTDIPLRLMAEGALLKVGLGRGAQGPVVVAARYAPLRVDRGKPGVCRLSLRDDPGD
ncbi:MAG TPA: CapA family protein [Polyangiaceae bacterium]|jgi:poly-gamma-glutamate synthesis protein (capsule biosynthesis protein)